MKILHVIPSVSRKHGGPSVAIWEIVASLHGQEVSVSILTTDDDGDGRTFASSPSDNAVSDVDVIVKARTSKFYITSWAAAVWLLRNVRAFDVVHVHALFSFMPVVAGLVARWRGIAFIVRPLGTLAEYGLSARRPLLKRISLYFFERPLLRDAAAVHCTSHAEALEVQAACVSARTIVIPLSVSQPKAVRTEHAAALRTEIGDGRVVLFLSRLDPKKNVETLLRAVAAVVATCPDVLFVIAGSGDDDYEKTLHGLAVSLGIDRHVRWLGNVEGDRKAAILAMAHVFVLPSFAENFGIAVAEALAAGLPCVVTPGVAIATEIEAASAGVVVKPNADCVAAGILWYLQVDEVRERASTAARGLAEREYSRDRLGERLTRLYKDVCNR